MFRYLYDRVQDMAIYLILVTAVLHALPDSEYKKYIRFFTGLVLIFMMLTPILKLLGSDGQIMNFYKSREYEKRVEEIEKASRYIEEHGSKYGITDIYNAGEAKGEGGKEGIGDIEVEEIRTDEDR